MKSKGVAYLLWLVGWFGCLGFHRFYLGKVGTGILWLFTGGLLGFGSLYDLFSLGNQVDLCNLQLRGGGMLNNQVVNVTVNVPGYPAPAAHPNPSIASSIPGLTAASTGQQIVAAADPTLISSDGSVKATA